MIHLGELMSAHLDGELSLAEARLVAGHLDVCGECRAEFDDLAAARAAVRSLSWLEVPESVTDSIPATPVRISFGSPRSWVAAAVATAVLAVGSVALVEEPVTESVTAGDLRAVYVARASVDTDLAPTPRYLDSRQLVMFGGGE